MKTALDLVEHNAMPEVLPIIPTMDVVVFPHIIMPLLVLDEKIITGINQSLDQSKMVLLLAAKNTLDTEGAIGMDDLYQVGTVASIMRVIKIPEGGIKILVQGLCKARAHNIITENNSLYAQIEKIDIQPASAEELQEPIALIKDIAESMASSGQAFSPDFHIILSKMQDPEKIADFILSHLTLEVHDAQALLEINSQKEFLEAVCHHLHNEINATEVQ